MEGGIDPDAPLDYVELQIFPSQNRYEACVCSSSRAAKVASGTLEHLLLHSPRVKDLSSKGLNTNFKILPPDNVNDAGWFTTATLTRFLHIIGSPDILSIGNEITQLEETRKFQLSLSVKAQVDVTSSIDSKNELLRAVDLRLTALKDEIAAALDQATGARCSTKDISDLENFAHHFGAKDIRDSLQKSVEMSIFPTPEKNSKNGSFKKTESSALAPQTSHLNSSLIYGGSPAKVAQFERRNDSTDENSSFSSEDDKPSVERSRAPTRSATPRRSASPMRRIQIGRSGSRRAAALTIKSLNYFPAREKVVFQRDTTCNSSDEEDEDPEKPAKKNVLRMSVQDKISLFESKQMEQKVAISKTKTFLNTTVGPNKAVLRRWSSGMGENAKQNPDNNVKSSPISSKDVAPEPENDISIFESRVSVETAENVKPQSPEMAAAEPESEESCEKHPDSIEWSQQKEAELNQLFMKMMENKNKPIRHRNPTIDITKSKKSPTLKEERGGIHDNYKQKRDEKLRGEASGKEIEKETQFKVMRQVVDEKKTEMVSANVNKPQKEKTQKNSTPLTHSRKEASKPSVLKKTTSKPSPLPATRKSWPSIPSPRNPTGPMCASTTPTSRKTQSTSSSVSSTKTQKSKPRSKTLKTTPSDANTSFKTINDKKQPTITKSTKTSKAKVQSSEVKPSFYNKVTKKSSVVPLETKPFLRKGSGIGPGGVDPVVIKKKVKETSRTLTQAEENEVSVTSDISENQNQCEPQVVSLSPTKCEETKNESEEVENQLDNLVEFKYEDEEVENESDKLSETKYQNEELVISPTAWVEQVENQLDNHEEEIIPCLVQTVSPAKFFAPAGTSLLGPRVRHSLSEMLLEESSEEADISEWGNAEHPPSLVYQKDSPKGFKRLLKFARKTKPDSAFSEGDDNAEEPKGQSNITTRFTSQNHPKVPEGHVNSLTSVNTTKATRSFFSLSAFRGSKTNESKLL